MTRARGHRLDSARVGAPDPQPRSTTISGLLAATLAVRSANGRRRWSLNFSYCSGFHVCAAVAAFQDLLISRYLLLGFPYVRRAH
jgi:hypothetical protein